MNWNQPKTYAVQHKNEEVRAASRSGGIFTAVSDYILNQGGVVYGCVLDDNLRAIHIRAVCAEDRDRMRGSKYIQSKLGDTYENVRRDLTNGRLVMFTGTSCQVAGLKQYLGREYDSLLCVDIVCHGVPSPKVWGEYLRWQEEKNTAEVRRVEFRNKTVFGWRAHRETLTFENGKSVSSNIFATLFYGHTILRPCCYECLYKSVMHPGDITIADYWGCEKAAPEMDDNKGVSLVLVNNENGEGIFDLTKKDVIWKETCIEDSIQPPLIAPFPQPQNRTAFWSDFSNKSFDYIVRKYAGVGFINKVKLGLKKVRRKMLE